MSGVWLRCDTCNRELHVEADQAMALAVRFKPSLFRYSLEQLDRREIRRRCRSCGWVNIYVPAPVELPEALTPNWRDAIVTK